MREILIRVRNVRINLYFVGAVACVLVVVFILTALFWMQKKPELFVVTSHSMTILTAPIATLPPHAHKADITGVDSVLAPGHGIIVNSAFYTVPFDMWITGISLETENAPRAVLHHLILFRKGYPNTQCPNRDEELYTIGADSRPDNAFPAPFGIFVKKGTVIYLNGMVHNPQPPKGPGGSYTDVSIGYNLTYERPSPKRYRAVAFYRFFLYENERCQDPIITKDFDVFTVPAGAQHFVKSAANYTENNPARLVIKHSGMILGTGGHLHEEDGGEKIELLKGNDAVVTLTPHHVGTNPWQWEMGRVSPSFKV
ncbi:MAG: hypothetical protein KA104_02040, partial [Candidatus Pacebacteria bacterium]|nr:hypothetical protein [Candidatus Paceibacterota bacterium]